MSWKRAIIFVALHMLLPACRVGYYMGNLPPLPRLGVPPLKLHDAGNGFRNMPGGQGKLGSTAPCRQSHEPCSEWIEHEAEYGEKKEREMNNFDQLRSCGLVRWLSEQPGIHTL